MTRFLFLLVLTTHFFEQNFAVEKACFHEFYLSICEIEYNEITNSLEISIRVFNDDLEKAVFNDNKGKIYDKSGNQIAGSNEVIKSYLLSKFTLSIDKQKTKAPDFIGWETEEGSVWCYFELKNVDDFKSLGISCTLLTEMFERQKNLIYLKKNKAEKSVILDKEKTFSVIEF